jgi:isopentenyldiphosphate isomerase
MEKILTQMKQTINKHLSFAQSDDEVFEIMKPPNECAFHSSIVHGCSFLELRAEPATTETTESRKWLERARTRTAMDRKSVHEARLWHRSVHVWVFDKERNMVLLQKRTAEKDTFPSFWDISAAGHVGFCCETQNGKMFVKNSDAKGAVKQYGFNGKRLELICSYNNDDNNNDNTLSGQKRRRMEEEEEEEEEEDDDNNRSTSTTNAFVQEADEKNHANSSRNTAAREIAEELGVNVDPHIDLTYAFTCAAEQASLGGCNCYEDVYFMHGDSSKGIEKFANIGKAEVDSVCWFNWDHLVATWEKDFKKTTLTTASSPKSRRERFFGSTSASPKSKSLLFENDANGLVPRHPEYVKTLDTCFKSIEIQSYKKVNNLRAKFENAKDGVLASPLKKPAKPKKK